MWLFFTFLVLTLLWFYQRLNKMSSLKRNGILVETPHIIFGNLFEMKGLSMIERQKRLIEKYGKIVGYYSGAKPNVIVADPELVKNIQIKNFHHFTDRTKYFRLIHPFPKEKSGALTVVGGQRWRQIRSLLSPAFSASKLRAMTPLLDDSINSFLFKVKEKSETGEEFNIYEYYQRLTLEMIIKCAFGLEVDAQNNFEQNKLFRAIHRMLETKPNKWLLLIIICLPEVENLILFLNDMVTLLFFWLGLSMWNDCAKIINFRAQNFPSKRNDILQAMLDSRISDEDMTNMKSERLTASNKINEDFVREQENGLKISKNNIRLNKYDIIENCGVFLGAGYETSSTALAYVTHFLINYPEVQEKVRQEVIELYESEGKIDFNVLTSLQYMECVLNESMRLFPPLVNGSTRECIQDYTYKNITIPKGASVIIGTHFLHHDPDYWPEPEMFDPMRFSAERRHEINPSSWQPFGDGPRNCIGIRLAYLKMKLTLAKLLLHYRLEAGPNSEIGSIKTKYKLLTMAPKNGVIVKVVKL